MINNKTFDNLKNGIGSEQLNNSMGSLFEWSGKQNYNIIFDSDVDGDGGNSVLMNKVMNKKNLYFISVDNENNVFGGYVSTIINTTEDYITDPNAFVFSLIRNGKVKNIKYNIKNSCQQESFYLASSYFEFLYKFGFNDADIIIYKIRGMSRCTPHMYEYNGEQNPLRDGKKWDLIKEY